MSDKTTVLKLFTIAGTCSLVPHFLLEMTGVPFEICELNRAASEQKSATYLAINPRGKVPALVIDGRAILENVAIQYYLALRYPDLEFAPRDLLDRVDWLTFLTWISNEVHPRYRQYRRPELFAEDTSSHDAIRLRGKDEFLNAMAEINRRLNGREWIFGNRFSTADTYAFVMHLWGHMAQFDMAEFTHLLAHGRRLSALAPVAKVLRREGIAIPDLITA